MKQSLQMKMGQQLAMTPQLQQAIKLLQLSTLELQTEIQQALESNPMLEVQEEGEEGEKDAAKMRSENEKKSKEEESGQDSSQDNSDSDTGSDSLEDLSATVEVADATPDIPDELPVDSAWEDIYEPAFGSGTMQGGEENQRDFTEYTSAGTGNLQDHLTDQLRLRTLSETDQIIAATILSLIHI